ncbi:DUF6597 domain-containing transcriptional factor [Nonomuraea sp. NPDC050643]|uniref:DUF6597 domain-containing transcriptional factor n=1 Tax=Nonomuraea sp. NPDC050643 TaxID=3155660 RepID=UPI0033CDBD6C
MYVERPPGADLADRVACEWRRAGDTDLTALVVPDACVDLIWGPSGPFVAGPDTGPMPVSMRAGDTLVGIRFKPGAVGDFFGVPLTDLRDARVPLRDLPGHDTFLSELAEQAAEHAPAAQPGLTERPDLTALPGLTEHPASTEARSHALRAAVRRRLMRSTATDPAAPVIASALRKGGTVTEVAWALGFSERQLQRRSLTSFGYAPKTLQRIVRFQRALKLARAGVPLAEVAATAGYTDQAHLANDVKRLSGVPMRQLI